MHDETMSSGVYLPEMDVAPASATTEARRFQFNGNARDYFRIWIVNVALSLVTLGIYSAWATVRTRRYMYANTTLAGSPFEYLARPIPILKGRLLTVLIFGAYSLAGRVSVPLQLAMAVVVAGFLPWLIVKSMMFRARYSSWRGLRFYFSDDYLGAYKWYLGVYFLMGIPFAVMLLFTLAGTPSLTIIGVLILLAGYATIYPWIKGHQQEWMVENHHFGGKSFRFDTEIRRYHGIYARSAGVALAWFIPCVMMLGGIMSSVGNHTPSRAMPSPYILLGVYAIMAPAYLGVWTFVHTRMTNMLYNQAHLGPYGFRSSLEYWPMLGLYLSNVLAVVFTLGLAMPWARIRLARYRAERLEVLGDGDLNDFVRDAFAHGEIGAAATEMDSLLGIDIGL